MAYNPYYGFKENPFNQTPDSSFFYPSEGHKTALDALTYAVKQRKGFVVITGEVGSGKTTVARTLMRNLDFSVQSALIINTHLSPKGVLTMILEDLGVAYKEGSKDKLLVQLNEYLIQQMRQDRNVVLLIDEAQNLSPACLEEVRMLSNLETEKEKLIQIVLIGQPELAKKLELPQLRQLKQRIAIHFNLKALDRQDVEKYIVHRLDTAKLNGQDYTNLFDRDAIDLISEQSGGVPRVINNICDHSLLAGFVTNAKTINLALAREAVQTVLRSCS